MATTAHVEYHSQQTFVDFTASHALWSCFSSQKFVNISHPSIWRSAHSTTSLILQEQQTPLVSDHSSTYLRSSGSHWRHCGSCRGDNRYLLVIISLRPPYFPLDDLGKESASNGEHWRILTGLVWPLISGFRRALAQHCVFCFSKISIHTETNFPEAIGFDFLY